MSNHPAPDYTARQVAARRRASNDLAGEFAIWLIGVAFVAGLCIGEGDWFLAGILAAFLVAFAAICGVLRSNTREHERQAATRRRATTRERQEVTR